MIYFAKRSKKVINISINGTLVNASAGLLMQGAFKSCQSGSNVIKLMTNLPNRLYPKKALMAYKTFGRS